MGRAKTVRKFPNAPYWVMLRDSEKKILIWAVEQSRHVRDVAQLLGVPPSFVYRRLKVHNLARQWAPPAGRLSQMWTIDDEPDPRPPPPAEGEEGT